MTQHPEDEYDKYHELCEYHTQPDGSPKEKVLCLQCRYPEPPPAKFRNDVGGYYARCDHESSHWWGMLCAARSKGAPREDIRYLEERWESAANTGD